MGTGAARPDEDEVGGDGDGGAQQDFVPFGGGFGGGGRPPKVGSSKTPRQRSSASVALQTANNAAPIKRTTSLLDALAPSSMQGH